MTMERVPYLVGGGFEHSAEVMRAMLAAATSGAEGIVNAGDMKVRPTSVPGTNVRVGPGNVLIRNSYGGGTAQTYAARASAQSEIAIAATGSAGARTDLIVARIDDPTYQGGEFDPATFEAAKFEVIRGVPSGIRSASELGLSYPAIALAAVTLPASTGTVTAAMIRDLRTIAIPRVERKLFVTALFASDGVQRIRANAAPAWWPLGARHTHFVDIPHWAQRARVLGTVGGVFIPGGNVDSWGDMWVRVGSWENQAEGFSTQAAGWNLDQNRAGNQRQTWMTGADLAIPSRLRGTTGRQIGVMIQLNGGGTQVDQLPALDGRSVVSLDIEFYETAV